MIEMVIKRIPYDIEKEVCKKIIKKSNYTSFIIICIVSLILIYFLYKFLRISQLS